MRAGRAITVGGLLLATFALALAPACTAAHTPGDPGSSCTPHVDDFRWCTGCTIRLGMGTPECAQLCLPSGVWGECADCIHCRQDGGPPPDARARDAATLVPDASAPLDAAPSRSGYVSVGQSSASGAGLGAVFGAVSLADTRRWILSPSCVVTAESGPCVAVRCSGATTTDEAGEVSARISTGLLLHASTPRSSDWAGASSTSYNDFGAPGSEIRAGDTITVQTTGGSVPPFTAVVTTPPSPSATLPTSVSRSHDLVVPWAATSAEQVQVELIPASGTAPPPWVFCSVAGADGSVTVAASVLAGFAVGDSVFVSVDTANITTVLAGDYAIDVRADQTLWTDPLPVLP